MLSSSVRSLVLAGLLSLASVAAAQSPATTADYEYFERKIRPLLSEHCYECHSASAQTVHGSLKLDSAQALNAGGDSGAAVVAGDSDASLLIQSIRYEGDYEMPPQGKLAEQDILELTRWVEQGAYFPPAMPGSHTAENTASGIDYEAGRQFWSFQPLSQPELPPVDRVDWPQTRSDSFVLAAMEERGLAPTSPADKRTLLRRLYFTLTGLPPTPEQVEDFVADRSDAAFSKQIDRLLDSPEYGEKWGRWWLDLARYTDRTASWLPQTTQAHLYRDWVVNAFCDDMPYAEFVHRQLATDLLPSTGPEDIPALGFIGLSPTYWKELKLPSEIIKVIVADEWEERVDAVSRTFLGLTVACARCHDHKFDPISADDYYAMAGVFASCRLSERPLIGEEEFAPVQAARATVEGLEAEIAKLKKLKPIPQEKVDSLTHQIAEIQSTTEHYDTPMANAVIDESVHVVRAGKTPQEGTQLEYRAEPYDLPSFIRGNPNRPGPVIPRRFLTVLTREPQAFQIGSGRLELAQAITSDAASLTARVLVNRVWLAHFGRGIVDTPSNFGRQGGRPTHPQLLDDLAARFIAQGWSIKWLHRELLLSAAWQQSTQGSQADPDNTWLSRMNRRRLTFEEWRDAMLQVSGELTLSRGGPAVALEEPDNHRRTLYATVNRRDISPTLMIHDFPDPNQHSPQRSPTTTALQGLFALNSPLLAQQAQALVHRLDREGLSETEPRVERIYTLLFARSATPNELALGLDYFEAHEAQGSQGSWETYCHAMLLSNEFIYID
ncbi:PSD1 and planctomycete cytochrome C domain-containing protein [Aureliella helgolandensis]|uniref:Planctomycete cytochrome C n=1 Tax=Aureliella helgolandensis TaxID=2527968 RepID=A0A518FZL7_9BACT|nr:PSD1 and planctomycete cytochrome C domain-containing protein [Aureliella helgolandensis]QDV21793.1 Planctomycete cytochrome C [Aureliella helgolandensis]